METVSPLKNHMRSASLQAGALLLSELTIKAPQWAKMKGKLGGARRKRKVRFYACANLTSVKFTQKNLSSTLELKSTPLSSLGPRTPRSKTRSEVPIPPVAAPRARPAHRQHTIAHAIPWALYSDKPLKISITFSKVNNLKQQQIKSMHEIMVFI